MITVSARPRLLTSGLLALVAAALLPSAAHADITGFGADGNTFTLNSYLSNANGTVPSYTTGTVTLTTDSMANQHSAASLFCNTAQDVDAFQAAFDYTVTSASSTKMADGVTFTLENDPRKATAVGGQGSSLGYGAPSGNTTPSTAAITKSAGISLDVFATPGTLLTGFESGGAVSYPNSATPANTVKLNDRIHVTLNYDGGTLTETVADTTQNTTATFSESVNIPALVGDSGAVGTNTAYVGVTGATGGSYSTQTISNFTYMVVTPSATPPPAVPEPSAWAVGLAGGVALVVALRERRRRRS